MCHLHCERDDAEAITGPGFCLGRAASDSDSPPPAGQWEHAAKENHQKKWPSMRWTLTTGVASNLYERLGTRLAANLMHGILLLEAIQGAIKTKVTSRAPFNAQAFAINPPPKKKASTPPRGGLDVLVIRLGRHHCSTYTSTSNPPEGGGKEGPPPLPGRRGRGGWDRRRRAALRACTPRSSARM